MPTTYQQGFKLCLLALLLVAFSVSSSQSADIHITRDLIPIPVDPTPVIVIDDGVEKVLNLLQSNLTLVTIICGTGESGDTGDGANSLNAKLLEPSSVFVNSLGEVFIVDKGAHRLRKIDTTGTITTLAGNGLLGNASIPYGTSVSPSLVPLNSPTGVILSNDNKNIYFSDTGNRYIKKISFSSTIVESSGLDHLDGARRAVRLDIMLPTVSKMVNFIGNGENGAVSMVVPDGTVLPNLFPLTTPKHFAIFNNTLYYSDKDRILVTSLSSPTVGQLVVITDNDLKGKTGLSIVDGLSFSSNGDLFICDRGNHRIRKYSTSTQTMETIVGGDQGDNNDIDTTENARFNFPTSITVSQDGTKIFIADTGNKKIKVLLIDQGVIKTIASSSSIQGTKYLQGDSAVINTPTSVFLDGDTLYFTDSGTYQVGKITFITCTSETLIPACFSNITCFGKQFNDSSTCSGQGNCTALDKCTCLNGFVGDQCQFTSNFTITTSNLSLEYVKGNNFALVVNTIESGLSNLQYVWNCSALNLNYQSSQNYYFFSSIATGVYTITVRANLLNNNGAVIRTSNILSITVKIVDNSVVNTFDSVLQIGSAPKALTLTQSQKINSLITGFNLDSNKFFNVLGQNQCNNCTNIFSLDWQLIYEERSYLRSEKLSVKGTTGLDNTNYTSLSLFPFVNVNGEFKLDGTTDFAKLSVSIGFNNREMTVNYTIPATMPIIRKNVSFDIQPPRGMALETIFQINEPDSNWKIYSMEQLPLSFAIGVVYNNKPLQLTDYIESSKTWETFLPFTKFMEEGKQANIVLFVKDNLSNIQTLLMEGVTMHKFNNGNSNDILQKLDTNKGLASILAFDTSVYSGYDEVIARSLQTINISLDNPSVGLEALSSMSEIINSSVSSSVNQKMESFIGVISDSYKTQKNQLGFVGTRLSEEDLKTVLLTASNLLSNGRESTIPNKLSSLLMISEVPKLVTSDTFPSPSNLASSFINITFSTFLKEAPSTGMNTRFDQVELNPDSILSQYSSFSSEVGLVLISYNGIVNSEKNSTFATNSKDFTLYRNGKAVPLQNLEKPFYISFKSANKIPRENNIVCKYWNETTLRWATDGCNLKSFVNETGEIVCSCTHTTLFSAFIEQGYLSFEFFTYVEQLIAVHSTQIALGCVYLTCSVVILVLLVVNAKKQPVLSRFATPYLGMFALIIQSALLLIVQRSVLISSIRSQTGSDSSHSMLINQSYSTKNDYLAANILSNIITIIVNTLTLSAIMTYLYQVMRYQFLKYFYNEIFSMKDKITSTRMLHFIKRLISAKFYAVLILSFAFFNVCYWTLWVVLLRTAVINGVTYTQIVSISYTVTILSIGTIVCCIFGIDIVMTWYQRNQYKSESQSNNNNTPQKNVKNLNYLKKVFNFCFDWLIRADSPLFFRVEMVLFVISFVFLVIVHAIGMASLKYRIMLEDGDNDSEQLIPSLAIRTVITYDSVSIIFEVLHIATYLLVYGGYSILVLLLQKTKFWRNSQDIEPKEEIYQHLSNPHFLKIFDKFCRKEFSLENLQLYVLLEKNRDIVEKADIFKVNEFLQTVFNDYVKSGAIREVNIPSVFRRSFTDLVNKIKQMDNVELVDEKKSTNSEVKKSGIPTTLADNVNENLKTLNDHVLVNLADTFSRFYLTSDFEQYSNSINTKEDLMKQSNLQ